MTKTLKPIPPVTLQYCSPAIPRLINYSICIVENLASDKNQYEIFFP